MVNTFDLIACGIAAFIVDYSRTKTLKIGYFLSIICNFLIFFGDPELGTLGESCILA